MVEGTETSMAARASVPPSGLLEALARAFSYPATGIEPTLEALHELDAQTAGAWSKRVAHLLETSKRFEDRTAEQLAYTRLFIGSFKMEAPPYASYYLEEGHLVNGRAAAEVAEIYRQFGIELSEGEFAPADHLRYLLSFLALMARRHEQTGESAFAQAYADFRDDYVLSWIDQCRELVDRYAEAPYYPELVGLIIDVLKDEGSASSAPEGD